MSALTLLLGDGSRKSSCGCIIWCVGPLLASAPWRSQMCASLSHSTCWHVSILHCRASASCWSTPPPCCTSRACRPPASGRPLRSRSSGARCAALAVFSLSIQCIKCQGQLQAIEIQANKVAGGAVRSLATQMTDCPRSSHPVNHWQVLAQKQNLLNILSRTTGHSPEKLDKVGLVVVFCSQMIACSWISTAWMIGASSVFGEASASVLRSFPPAACSFPPAACSLLTCRRVHHRYAPLYFHLFLLRRTCSGRCTCSPRTLWIMASSMEW